MNLQESIERIKNIMEQTKASKPDDVMKFQNWVINTKKDPKILGVFGADGKWGKNTSNAWSKYGEEYEKMTTDSNANLDVINKDSKSDIVILMGGLDYRPGDLNITQQKNVLQSKLPNKKVIGFRYTDLTGVLNAIKNNPDSYVVLFSAGCSKSAEIANAMTDKSKLFIVEPYAASSSVASSVSNAVSSGTPSSNVVAGPNKARGDGAVAGATKTPPNYDHWGALDFVTTLIS